jgi:hypothetical protein
VDRDVLCGAPVAKPLIFHLWDVGIVIPERIYDGGKNDM